MTFFLSFILDTDLEKKVKSSMLCELHEEVFPFLPSKLAAYGEKSGKSYDLTFFAVHQELVDLFLNQLCHFFVQNWLVEVDLVQLYVRHCLLFIYRQTSIHLNCFFDCIIRHLFLGAWALDEARLIVQFVIDFRTSHHDIAEHVLFEATVVMLLHKFHVLNLTDYAHHAQVQKLQVCIVHEVG